MASLFEAPPLYFSYTISMALLFEAPPLPISSAISMASLFEAPTLYFSYTISMALLFVAPSLPISLHYLDGFVVPSSICFNCYRSKLCVDVIDMYLLVLNVATWFGAALTSTVRLGKVTETVSVAPSGRFPSVRDGPTGSLATGISARLMALHVTSLSWACCCYLALLRLHDNP